MHGFFEFPRKWVNLDIFNTWILDFRGNGEFWKWWILEFPRKRVNLEIFKCMDLLISAEMVIQFCRFPRKWGIWKWWILEFPRKWVNLEIFKWVDLWISAEMVDLLICEQRFRGIGNSFQYWNESIVELPRKWWIFCGIGCMPFIDFRRRGGY